MAAPDQKLALLEWKKRIASAVEVGDRSMVENALPLLLNAASDGGPLTESIALSLHYDAMRLVALFVPWELRGRSKMLRDRIRRLAEECDRDASTASMMVG